MTEQTITQPTVVLTINSTAGPSFIAFDERGELIEAVEVDENGLPDWADAGICDHRGDGGEEGFKALHDALTAAESNARSLGLDVRRLGAV